MPHDCGLYLQLLSFEFFTRNVFDNVLLGQQFSNPGPAFTIGGHARTDFAEIIDSCAQLINFFTFSCLGNDGQAENITLARNGGDRELEKVHASVTKDTGDVCTELKIPSSKNGAERVGKHPYRRHINSHYVPFGDQFVSNHDVFIEGHVIIYCRINVLEHQLGPRTADAKLRQFASLERIESMASIRLHQ